MSSQKIFNLIQNVLLKKETFKNFQRLFCTLKDAVKEGFEVNWEDEKLGKSLTSHPERAILIAKIQKQF